MNQKITAEDFRQQRLIRQSPGIFNGPNALLKRSKYGVDQSEAGKARRTVGGVKYGSQLEATVSAYLAILHPLDLRKQIPFELKVGGRKVAKYVADFVAGTTVYEAKGKLMADARIKLNLFKALHPEMKLFLVTKGTSKNTPIEIREWL